MKRWTIYWSNSRHRQSGAFISHSLSANAYLLGAVSWASLEFQHSIRWCVTTVSPAHLDLPQIFHVTLHRYSHSSASALRECSCWGSQFTVKDGSYRSRRMLWFSLRVASSSSPTRTLIASHPALLIRSHPVTLYLTQPPLASPRPISSRPALSPPILSHFCFHSSRHLATIRLASFWATSSQARCLPRHGNRLSPSSLS